MEATGTRWETARVEAFSDGVFAIAITLLVLEIGVDPADFDHLWQALADEWPSYLAYVTSFLTVGGVWLAHHRLFSHLRYVDPMLLFHKRDLTELVRLVPVAPMGPDGSWEHANVDEPTALEIM